jgi:hypothetical protein
MTLTGKAIIFKDELREIGFILGIVCKFVLYITSEHQPQSLNCRFFFFFFLNLNYFILFYFTEAQQ